MKKSALIFALVVGLTCLASMATSQSPTETEYQEMRLLAETSLSKARKDFSERLTDTDVKKAFSRDQNVVAVLLQLTYRGQSLREMRIYTAYNDNTKVFHAKTLNDGDRDIKTIKEGLGL